MLHLRVIFKMKYFIFIDLGFFIETTSGERKRLDDSNYLSINSVWNNDNYWLAKNDDWRSSNSLDLPNKENWIKFVCDLDKQPDSSPKRLLNNLHQWLGPLVVPGMAQFLFEKLTKC